MGAGLLREASLLGRMKMPSEYRRSRLTELLLRIMDMVFVSCSYSWDLERSHQVNRRLPVQDRRQLVNTWPEALFECIFSSLLLLQCIELREAKISGRPLFVR